MPARLAANGQEVRAGIFLFVLVFVAVPALLTLVAALIPSYVERARAVVRAHPWRSFLVGLLNLVFFAALALLQGIQDAPVQIMGGLAFFVVLPVCAALGLLVAASVVGERVWKQLSSRGGSLLGTMLLGMLLLDLSLLVPILGWVLFVVLVSIGLGAAVLALLRREQPDVAPSAAEGK